MKTVPLSMIILLLVISVLLFVMKCMSYKSKGGMKKIMGGKVVINDIPFAEALGRRKLTNQKNSCAYSSLANLLILVNNSIIPGFESIADGEFVRYMDQLVRTTQANVYDYKCATGDFVELDSATYGKIARFIKSDDIIGISPNRHDITLKDIWMKGYPIVTADDPIPKEPLTIAILWPTLVEHHALILHTEGGTHWVLVALLYFNETTQIFFWLDDLWGAIWFKMRIHDAAEFADIDVQLRDTQFINRTLAELTTIKTTTFDN